MDIESFLKERDEILLSGDLDRMIALHARHNPGSTPPTREVAEIGLHKSRTAVIALPREVRAASKRWLKERGYSSLDDGDL